MSRFLKRLAVIPIIILSFPIFLVCVLFTFCGGFWLLTGDSDWFMDRSPDFYDALLDWCED